VTGESGWLARASAEEGYRFAIERAQVRGWVACARDRTARRDGLDLGNLAYDCQTARC